MWEVLDQIWGKSFPFASQKEFFLNIYYCHLRLLIVPYHRTNLKKTFRLDYETKAYKVFDPIWDKNGTSMAEKSFLKIFTMVTFVYL